MKDVVIPASIVEAGAEFDPLALGAAVRSVALGGSRLTDSELAGVIGSRYFFNKHGAQMKRYLKAIERHAMQEDELCDSSE